MGPLNYKAMILIGGLFSFALLVLFSPMKEVGENYWNAVALGGLMVLFWIFEVIPIYVTALLPLVLAIPLGVLTADDLAAQYGNRMVFLFFGGFVLSLALEKWDVHKRIAEGIIRMVGSSAPRLILGFLLATALLSMWISNTATALMMLPMATAVIHSATFEKTSRVPLFLMLAIAYGASLGGMATVVGSPPNTAMVGILESTYGISISFFDWMKFGLPISLIMLLATYFVFYLLLGKERKRSLSIEHPERTKWTIQQKSVLALFLVVVVLWSFKDLIVSISGIQYNDEGPAMLGAILLFIIPATKKTSLLEWKDTVKLPWGVLLLFGGGLALAKMMEINGVVTDVSTIFKKFEGGSVFLLLLLLVSIAIYATEVMSNLALVNVLVPVVATFAVNSEFDVLQLCLPVTLAASCAFMLPVSTPPNAIVFSSGNVTISSMARVGFILNLFGVLIVTLFSWIFI
jgi:sodium-dependent dicarboxylate transporter 2/3/5